MERIKCNRCGANANRVSGTNKYFCYFCQEYVDSTEEKKKTNKYGATKAKVNGVWFDSQKEANYYSELELRMKAGDIAGFCYKAKFLLKPETEHATKVEYIVDFIIFENDDTYKIIDTKGMETKSFILKKKWFDERFKSKLLLELVK